MYRQVIVQREARIYQKENQLVIENETAHRIPIEDIDTLVIANRRVNISVYCLDSLMANGSSVVICGKNYHPTGIVLPFAGYSRKLKMLRAQIDQPKPRLKQLWRTIVQQKILNQGKCLQLAGRKDVVSALSEQVRSGDKGNVEGWAVRICNGYEAAQKHIGRLKEKLPEYGSVRALTVTEKQFMSMQILCGQRHPDFDKNHQEQMVLDL